VGRNHDSPEAITRRETQSQLVTTYPRVGDAVTTRPRAGYAVTTRLRVGDAITTRPRPTLGGRQSHDLPEAIPMWETQSQLA
jgi:hypothetical protein